MLALDVMENLVFADMLHLRLAEAADGDDPCFESVLGHDFEIGEFKL